MKLKSTPSKLAFSVLLLAGAAVPASADVKITYSDALAKSLPAVERVEQQREKTFRKYRTESGKGAALRSRDFLNKTRYAGTEWGNERAIPELTDFSVSKLLSAMLERGVAAANPGFDGDILVHIDTMRVQNHSVSVLGGANTFMAGTVTLVGADGSVIAEEKIKAYPTRSFSVSRNYKGEEYAYRTNAVNTRVGPIFANFTEAALEKLFPEYDAPGFILLSD